MCDEQNNFCQKTKYCFALSFLQAAEMVIMGFAIFLTMMISTGALVIVWQFKTPQNDIVMSIIRGS